MSDDIKRMPIKEFRGAGYLHEVNRLVLHPLGLAMEVQVVKEDTIRLDLRAADVKLFEEISRAVGDAVAEKLSTKQLEQLAALLARIENAPGFEAGDEILGGVWDYREDPEGIDYGDDLLSQPKAAFVAGQMFARRKARSEALGYVVQPVGGTHPTLTTTYVDPAERTQR